MKAPRLDEVPARVVAWHNRHPLARRISASQVHGIGEVVLPFASALPVAAPPAPPAAPDHLPTIEELLAAEAIPPEVARFDALVRRAAHPPTEAPAEVPAGPAPDAPADDVIASDAEGEAALEIPLLDDDPAADEPPAPGPAGGGTDDEVALADAPTLVQAGTAVEASQVDLVEPAAALAPPAGPRFAARSAAQHADQAAAAGLALPPPAATAATAATPALPAWRRLLARLTTRGTAAARPRLQPLFDEDFLWPLAPRRIARWARRHGALQPIAPADWPHRVIATEPRLRAARRLRGQAHEAGVHVLSAAIGVGDRRMRVLVAPDGRVLGPRSYSPTRLAVAAAAAALALLAGGWWLRQWSAAGTHGLAAPVAAPAAASAPGAPAEAAAVAAVPASAAASAAQAQVAPDAEVGAHAASQPHSQPHSQQTSQQASQPADAAAAARAASSAAPASAPATPAAETAAPAASAPQADIRPRLSDDERRAARAQGAQLRGEPPPPPPVTAVFAVVSLPERQREAALRAQALMQAAGPRLDVPAPEHAELMGQPGQWRVAWWPFATLADAERARVLLAGRGLKAEVLEF